VKRDEEIVHSYLLSVEIRLVSYVDILFITCHFVVQAV